MNSDVKFVPNREWLYEKYDEMNQRFFGGKLGACDLNIFTTGRGSQGNWFGFFSMQNKVFIKRTNRVMFVKDEYGDEIQITRRNFVELCKPEIKLNGNYKGTERAWLNTLIHEMCHYYTYMNGFAPTQAHGTDFRTIASHINIASKGEFQISRTNDAKVIGYELNGDMAAKQEQRSEKKKNKIITCIVYKTDNDIRLINASNINVVSEVVELERKRGCNKIITSSDPRLIEMLYNNGYKKTMRTYRYWNITNEPWARTVQNDYDCVIQVGNTHPQKEVTQPIDEFNSLEWLRTYENGKYNMVDKKGNKVFPKGVDDVYFKNGEWFFRLGKFTYHGEPHHWQKLNVNENKRKMNDKELKQLVEEKVLEVLKEKLNGDNKIEDVVEITPNMNLSFGTPLENEI